MTLSVSFSGRLEFQHGLGLPVPQLESVRGGVRAAVRLCSRSSHFYAWEPSLLPGGKRERRSVYRDAGSSVISLNDDDDDSYRRITKSFCGMKCWCRWSCIKKRSYITEVRLCIHAEVSELWGASSGGGGELKGGGALGTRVLRRDTCLDSVWGYVTCSLNKIREKKRMIMFVLK